MTDARLRRLADELGEAGLTLDTGTELDGIVLAEVDYALRPHVHERRVPSVGALVEPGTDPERWQDGSGLLVTRRAVESMPLNRSRLFADGLASWLIRRVSGDDEWAVFDRPAGSERDLVVLAAATTATIVQRHPSGSVRIVGTHGVLRWDGLSWHHEPPISTWIDSVTACGSYGGAEVLTLLLEFAVHDLGARGIGAILVFGPDHAAPSMIEVRLPTPPALDVTRPFDLAPLRHALSQLDGAAVLDTGGVLRELGVRLVPSPEAVSSVEGFRGLRHTSARRYSFDDPAATVIVVSEDGPVTVLRNGELLGRSR
jgi:hypothetical protein